MSEPEVSWSPLLWHLTMTDAWACFAFTLQSQCRHAKRGNKRNEGNSKHYRLLGMACLSKERPVTWPS